MAKSLVSCFFGLTVYICAPEVTELPENTQLNRPVIYYTNATAVRNAELDRFNWSGGRCTPGATTAVVPTSPPLHLISSSALRVALGFRR